MKAAIYCRVSTEDQAEAKTIEAQVDFARKYCDLHSIPIYDMYLDDGVTGTIEMEQRPAGMRLLRDAGLKRFSLVLVYRLDRLARNALYILSAVDKLDKQGITFRSMTEPFDTSTPAGKLFMTQLASFAAFERDSIVERTSMGKDRRAKNGGWPGGPTPYGYRVGKDGRLEINEDEAEVVRLLYRLYVHEGMGLIPLCDYLNASNVPSPSQYRGRAIGRVAWQPGTVCRILKNSTNKGVHEFRKASKSDPGIIYTQVPAIIDAETWERARLIAKRNWKNASRNARRFYLLRGLIKCQHCGGTFIGSGRDWGQYRYQCSGTSSYRRPWETKCRAKSLRAVPLEEAIWQDIKEYVENPGRVLDRIEEQLKQRVAQAQPMETELATVERAIAHKQVERERLVSLYRKGLITDPEVESQLSELACEVETLVGRKDRLLERRADEMDSQSRLISAQVMLKQFKDKAAGADDKTKRELIEALVESVNVEPVLVGQEGHHVITVTYTFAPPENRPITLRIPRHS